jgi:hypothetical protein
LTVGSAKARHVGAHAAVHEQHLVEGAILAAQVHLEEVGAAARAHEHDVLAAVAVPVGLRHEAGVVADQRRRHGARGDHEQLEGVGADEHREEEREHQRVGPAAQVAEQRLGVLLVVLLLA